MAAGNSYCLGINSNDFFLKDNKKAFILWLNVPKVTAYTYAKLCVLCFKNNSNTSLVEYLIHKAKYYGTQFIEGDVESSLRQSLSDKQIKKSNEDRQRNVDF